MVDQYDSSVNSTQRHKDIVHAVLNELTQNWGLNGVYAPLYEMNYKSNKSNDLHKVMEFWWFAWTQKRFLITRWITSSFNNSARKKLQNVLPTWYNSVVYVILANIRYLVKSKWYFVQSDKVSSHKDRMNLIPVFRKMVKSI